MRIFEMSPKHRTPSIRMINLVDILLNLLIFFIASTTFRVMTNEPTAVKLSLPVAKTAEEVGKEQSNHVRITVASDDTVYLNKDRIPLSGLEKALREAKARNPNLLLEFSADKSVNYGTVVAIVDAARAAGIRDITAFTKKSAQ
ncbi:MAG TPA: biopolymer transporter ExbD [Verrucomicrobiae bacterium]|nr:biopolymer transporter ExbD [Verrucomicrobiae bacterium]